MINKGFPRKDVRSLSAHELADWAQGDDDSALEELYRRNSRWILRMARGQGLDDAECEDAVHEVFARVLAALDDYDPDVGAFEPWIVVIARNTISSHLARMRTRRRFDAGDAGWREAESRITHRHGQDGTLHAKLDYGKDSLPQSQRQVLFLRFDVGLDTADIAVLLDRTPEAVRQLQSRALRQLRRGLRDTAPAPQEVAISI